MSTLRLYYSFSGVTVLCRRRSSLAHCWLFNFPQVGDLIFARYCVYSFYCGTISICPFLNILSSCLNLYVSLRYASPHRASLEKDPYDLLAICMPHEMLWVLLITIAELSLDSKPRQSWSPLEPLLQGSPSSYVYTEFGFYAGFNKHDLLSYMFEYIRYY